MYKLFILNMVRLTCFLLFLLVFQTLTLFSQTDTARYWETSLEKLLKTQVVTASKYSQKINEVASTVRIITAQQIQEHGYFTLDDVLNDMPGFQFRNIQGFNSYVFLRGLPNQNNYIILMVDGITINELNSGGFYAGGQFNLNNVKQIEIVYGPSSVLYGTNALTGVINIITNNPENNSLTLNVASGSFNTFCFDGTYSFYNKTKKTGLILSGMFKTTDKTKLTGEDADNNWSNKMENFEINNGAEAKFIYKNLTSGIVFHDEQASRTTLYPSVGTNYLDYGTNWHISFLNAYINHHTNLNEKTKLISKIYYRNTTVLPNTISYILKADSINPGDQAGNYRPNYLAGAEVQLQLNPIENILVITGGNFEFEKISDGFGVSHSFSEFNIPFFPGRPEMLSNFLESFFASGQVSFLKKMKFDAGIRFDNSTVYHQVLTPRAGLIFSDKKVILKAMYNEAFRAPKNWDYTYGNGNPDLLSERIRSVEFSFVLPILKNMDINGSVYKNFLTNGLVKNQELNIWENHSKTNVSGIESGFSFEQKIFKIYGNYTYLNAVDENGNKIPEIANHTANAGVFFNLSSHFKIDLNTNYYGKKINPQIISATGSNIIDDALIFNATINFLNFHNFSFKAGVRNLFDKAYYHTSNLQVQRYLQAGRMLFAQITYQFK